MGNTGDPTPPPPGSQPIAREEIALVLRLQRSEMTAFRHVYDRRVRDTGVDLLIVRGPLGRASAKSTES